MFVTIYVFGNDDMHIKKPAESRFFYESQENINPSTNRVYAQSARSGCGFSRPGGGTSATSEP